MRGELESLVGLLAVLAVYWLVRQRAWRPNLEDHGAAGFATDAALERRGFFGRKGLVLGRSVESGRLIRHRRYVNLCVLGPPGVGKSSGLSIPWLMTCPSSIFALDIKAELFQAAAHVRRRMGQKVFLLDPFAVVAGERSNTINVFDLIADDLTCIDDIRAICESLVPRTGEEKEAFWQDAAVSVLVVAMVAVALYAKPENRNLASVRKILTDPGEFDPKAKKRVPLINRFCFRMQDAGVPVLAAMAGFVLGLEDETRGSVFAVANQNVIWMDSLAIQGVTQTTDFDLRELLTGRATLFVVLPPWALESQARWLRMMFSTFVRLVGKEGTGKQEILCLLDECGQLGAMPALDQALSLMRSYGLRLVMMFQSITQLKSTFKGKEGLVLDNAELIAMGTQSYETAKLLSDMLGAYTRVITSYSENDGRSHTERDNNPAVNVSHGSTLSVSSISRPLLSPDQILQLPNNAMLCFIKGVPPVCCARLSWWREPHLKALHARR